MMRLRHLLARVIFLLLLSAGAMPSAIKAAEIELFDGFEPGQKVILIRGPIEPGDDSRFYELAKQADRAIVFLESRAEPLILVFPSDQKSRSKDLQRWF